MIKDDLKGDVRNSKMFVINDKLYIYFNEHGKYLFSYDGNNEGITNKYFIDDIEYIIDFIIDEINKDIYIIPALDEEYEGNLNNKILRLENINDEYVINYIDAGDNNKYGFLNGFIINNKLILCLNNDNEKETYGYYKFDTFYVNEENLNYNRILEINNDETKINNDLKVNNIIISNGFNIPTNPYIDEDIY